MKPKVLCIATKCKDVAEFIAKFHTFVDDTSLFIATSAVRDVGSEAPIAVTLADRTPVLRGWCTVVEIYNDANNRFGRPGFRVELDRLTQPSEDVFAQLKAARSPKPPTLTQQLHVVSTPAATPTPTLLGLPIIRPPHRQGADVSTSETPTLDATPRAISDDPFVAPEPKKPTIAVPAMIKPVAKRPTVRAGTEVKGSAAPAPAAPEALTIEPRHAPARSDETTRGVALTPRKPAAEPLAPAKLPGIAVHDRGEPTAPRVSPPGRMSPTAIAAVARTSTAIPVIKEVRPAAPAKDDSWDLPGDATEPMAIPVFATTRDVGNAEAFAADASSAVAEVAKQAARANAEQMLAATPKPAATKTAAMPVIAVKPIVAAKAVEAPKVVEAAKPVEAPKPIVAPKPVEAARPIVAPKPIDVPVRIDAPLAAKLIITPKPAEPAPVAAAKPVEAPMAAAAMPVAVAPPVVAPPLVSAPMLVQPLVPVMFAEATPRPQPAPTPATPDTVVAQPPVSRTRSVRLADGSAPFAKLEEVPLPIFGNGLERTPGSEIVLPANPFFDLTDASLEGIVECRLFEAMSHYPTRDDAPRPRTTTARQVELPRTTTATRQEVAVLVDSPQRPLHVTSEQIPVIAMPRTLTPAQVAIPRTLTPAPQLALPRTMTDPFALKPAPEPSVPEPVVPEVLAIQPVNWARVALVALITLVVGFSASYALATYLRAPATVSATR